MIYTMGSLQTTCLVRVSHQHSLQDMRCFPTLHHHIPEGHRRRKPPSRKSTHGAALSVYDIPAAAHTHAHTSKQSGRASAPTQAREQDIKERAHVTKRSGTTETEKQRTALRNARCPWNTRGSASSPARYKRCRKSDAAITPPVGDLRALRRRNRRLLPIIEATNEVETVCVKSPPSPPWVPEQTQQNNSCAAPQQSVHISEPAGISHRSPVQ